jgi:hypothetical protein
MHPSGADVVGLDRKAGQDRLHADCPCLAVRFIGAFHADQKFHRRNRRDGGIVNAEHGVNVELAALVKDNLLRPDVPCTRSAFTSVKASRRSAR